MKSNTKYYEIVFIVCGENSAFDKDKNLAAIQKRKSQDSF